MKADGRRLRTIKAVNKFREAHSGERRILVASRAYDLLDKPFDRVSAAMITLESSINPMRADSAVHDDC